MARTTKPRRRRGKRYLSLLLTFVLIAGNVPARVAYSDDQPAPASAVQAAEPTPAQLQQLASIGSSAPGLDALVQLRRSSTSICPSRLRAFPRAMLRTTLSTLGFCSI